MSDEVRESIASLTAALTQTTQTPVAVGYGVDLVCFDDLTPILAETDPNSVLALGQDLYHRITTDRGSVPDDDDYGINVTAYLSRDMTDLQINRAQGEIAAELVKDDRVDSVVVAVTTSGSVVAPTLSISIQVTPIDPAIGVFTLIVAVTDGATLLQEIQSNPT